MSARHDADPPRRGLLDITRDELLAAVELRTDLDSRLTALRVEIERRGLGTDIGEPVGGRDGRPAGQA